MARWERLREWAWLMPKYGRSIWKYWLAFVGVDGQERTYEDVRADIAEGYMDETFGVIEKWEARLRGVPYVKSKDDEDEE